MKNFSEDKLESLALGAALLGSGGGGNPAYSLMIARRHLQEYGPVKIISLSELKDDDLVVPLGFMGAPLVSRERIVCDREIEAILTAIEKTYGRMPKALTVTEIGGSNAFSPFYIASKLGLPIVDADLIGRAFPQLQMVSTTVHGLKPSFCFMSDIFGNTVTLQCSDLNRVEKYARQLTMAFGSSAAVVLHVLKGHEAKKVMIEGSISQACKIGDSILMAQKHRKNAAQEVLSCTPGKWIGSGTITDIDQTIQSGFLQGSVTLSDSKDSSWKLKYQNEYLFIYKEKERIAATPDIIALLDAETGVPITSESLSFGLRVDILTFLSPKLWYSPKGLELVGPKVFNAQELQS